MALFSYFCSCGFFCLNVVAVPICAILLVHNVFAWFLLLHKIQMFAELFPSNFKHTTILLFTEWVLNISPFRSLCITSVRVFSSLRLLFLSCFRFMGGRSFKSYENCFKTICKYNIATIFAAFGAVNLSNYK